jgi:hypothetical protein
VRLPVGCGGGGGGLEGRNFCFRGTALGRLELISYSVWAPAPCMVPRWQMSV